MMNVKLLIMILAFTVPTSVGLLKAYGLKKRLAQLQEIRDSINRFKLEILYMRSAPQSFFIKEKSVSPLFLGMSQYKGETSEIYDLAKMHVVDQMYLKKMDWQPIDHFFNSVGKNNLSNQDKLCTYTIESLDEKILNAKETCGKYFKLYYLSGIMTGLFFIVILF